MTTRGLVLGGGGVVGIAWELGLLEGLVSHGVDLRTADVIVGTSAGSAVGAQITSGASLESLVATQVAPLTNEQSATIDIAALAAAVAELPPGSDRAAVRRRIGQFARDADVPSLAERRSIVASRLPSLEWPDQPLLLTAVECESGERVAFSRDHGVPLVDAVAASCAVPGTWAPVEIDGRHFMDGGVWSVINADLAGGHDVIVVIAPFDQLGTVGAEVDGLREDEAGNVVLVRPDEAATAAMGDNVLDPAYRRASAEAGAAQAVAVAKELSGIW